MPNVPDRLNGGEDIRLLRDWLNRLRDAVLSMICVGGKNIRVENGVNQVISLVGNIASNAGGSSNSLKIIQLIAQVDDDTYTGNVYGNGKDNDPTEEDVTIKILSIASGEEIPLNDYYFAVKQTHGTGESQANYYTIDIPRWL